MMQGVITESKSLNLKSRFRAAFYAWDKSASQIKVVIASQNVNSTVIRSITL